MGSGFTIEFPLRTPLEPVLILILCVMAGIGTVLLLPSRREVMVRKIGGTILISAGLILAALLIHAAAADPRAPGAPRGGMGAYFWIFSALTVLGAVRVVTHPRPVYSALWFVMSILASAGLFILLWAEFVAIALVIIYAGAILVTYVFVIMLASASEPSSTTPAAADAALAEHDRTSREPLLASAVGFLIMGLLLFLIFHIGPQQGSAQQPLVTEPFWAAPADRPHLGHVQALGEYLFSGHLVSVQLAGLILTLSMVGAIVIARRRTTADAEPAGAEEVVLGPATPADDNPHSLPVVGIRSPGQRPDAEGGPRR